MQNKTNQGQKVAVSPALNRVGVCGGVGGIALPRPPLSAPSGVHLTFQY